MGSAPLMRQATPLQQVAAFALGIYLALQAMYAHEILGTYFKLPIPILILSGLPVLFMWFLIGEHGRFLRCAIAIPYLALLGWWWVCTLVGSLKGEYSWMLLYGLRFHLTPFIFCGIALTFGLVRTVVSGFGLGFIGALAACAKFGRVDDAGRFSIPNTSLANPNDLALHLLMGMSFLCILAFDKSNWKRLLWFVSFGLTLYFILKTGSRANLLTLGVVLVIVFLCSTYRMRLFFVMSASVLGCLLAFAIPRATWVRLTTFFTFSAENYEENAQVANASASTNARKQLQIRAIKLTLKHPVFGVGPHMFVYALDEYMRAEENARKGSWQVPHNTYLDISSETGLPGLILYCTVVFWCVRTNYRWLKRAQREPGLADTLPLSISLLLGSVAFMFGTLFCSIPYTSTINYLVGLTAASQLALREYDRRRAMQKKVAGTPLTNQPEPQDKFKQHPMLKRPAFRPSVPGVR